MAPATRKRTAAPAADADSAAAAPATKKAKRAAAKPSDDSDDENNVRQPAKFKTRNANGRSKAESTKLSDEEAEDATSNGARPGRTGKAKTKAPAEHSEDDTNALTPPVKDAKAKTDGKTKANLKVEPDDDANSSKAAASTTNAAKASAKPKGKGKAKVEADPEVKNEDQANAGATDDSIPKVPDAQFAKSQNLRISLDEECQMAAYRVHVDQSNGIIYDAALNQTNAGNNNNKFYKIQLITNGNQFHTWTRWGRVGERGQNATLGTGSFADALVNFDKKFKDKTGLRWDDRGSNPKSGKYVFVEKSYEPDSDDEAKPTSSKGAKGVNKGSSPKCTLEPPVKSLMELIFNQEYFEQAMQDMNYDAEKLPLGKLSKGTITRGYQALKDLAALMNDPSLAETAYDNNFYAAVEELSNLYYSLIPHAFGRNRPPVIRDEHRLKQEVDLMDSLMDLKEADQIIKLEKDDIDPVHPLDSRYKGLGMQEMSPIDPKSQEFAEISHYLVKTCGSTHGLTYDVRDVFRIERHGENDRFEKSNFSKIESDRRLLWHGSRTTNFGGILSQGLRIAPKEAPVSGYAFGKGVYLADMSSKSANYCHAGISNGEALLLLCEAELGKPMQTLTSGSYTAGEDAIKKGMWSTWGQGNTGPKGWKDAGCIHPSLSGVQMPDTAQAPGNTGVTGGYLIYNEYIVYDVAQIRLRYLLRVTI